jgi:hypothetical protein
MNNKDEVKECAVSLRRSFEACRDKEQTSVGEIIDLFWEETMERTTEGMEISLRERFLEGRRAVYQRVITDLGLEGKREEKVSDYLMERAS